MIGVRVSLKLEGSWDFFSRRIEWCPKQIVLIHFLEYKTNKQNSHKSLFESWSKNTWKYMKLKYLDQLRKRQVLFLNDREATRRVRPSSDVVVLPCRTKFWNYVRQKHGRSTASESNFWIMFGKQLSSTSAAVLHGSGTAAIQTSCFCRAKQNS